MYSYPCKILKVIDGDTIDVELDLGFDIKLKERVRLINVDTPEVFGPNASEEGNIAKEFVEEWFATRQGVFSYHSLKYHARDKYGRSLGIISWDNGLNETLNSALKAKGWGVN